MLDTNTLVAHDIRSSDIPPAERDEEGIRQQHQEDVSINELGRKHYHNETYNRTAETSSKAVGEQNRRNFERKTVEGNNQTVDGSGRKLRPRHSLARVQLLDDSQTKRKLVKNPGTVRT